MADIEKKTINQLVELEDIEDSDYVIVEDFTGTSDIATKKAKVGNIKSDLYRKSEIDTKETTLNGRIDNIIAQSGTSDTEVVDARYDSTTSTTYTTLSKRLNAEKEQLDSALYVDNERYICLKGE